MPISPRSRIDIPRTIPLGDPYSAAIFALPGRSAELVTVRGKVLVERGRAVSVDSGALGSRAKGRPRTRFVGVPSDIFNCPHSRKPVQWPQ